MTNSDHILNNLPKMFALATQAEYGDERLRLAGELAGITGHSPLAIVNLLWDAHETGGTDGVRVVIARELSDQ